jgi:transcription antitermination factor NusG
VSIKCGHCPGRHETVAEVRSCATSLDDRAFDVMIQQRERSEDEAVVAFKMRRFTGEADTPETSVQEYLRHAASLADGHAAAARVERGGWTGKPAQRTQPAEHAKVADGRYAIEEDGTLKFFKLTNGRKPGYVFLDIQASDEWHAIRNVTRIHAIVAEIAKDAHAAMIRYGRELGQCGHCGRMLTDESSRAAGIGPICAGKM